MNKRKQSSRQTPKKEKPNYLLITAIIAAFGVVIAAIISYFGAVNQVLLPIEATQTAEAFHTTIAMTQTSKALETFFAMTQTASELETSIAMVQTANAIESSIAMTQTVEVLETSIAMAKTAEAIETSIAMTRSAEALETSVVMTSQAEIKPIRYEYTVEVGNTLKEISKKYFIVDFYADAIGRANCNPSPVAGDTLVIKYYYIQQGDTLDVIVERFGSKVSFVRYINNLSQEVILLPAGQILMLPGSCSDS